MSKDRKTLTSTSASSVRASLTVSMSEYYFNIAKIFMDKSKIMETAPESTQLQIYEYIGCALHSFISSVTGLEAYVNESLSRICGIRGKLVGCGNKSHIHRPSIEDKICKIYRKQLGGEREYELDDCICKLIYLRNQYMHYDYEAMTGDRIDAPVIRKEKQLDDVLAYLECLVSSSILPRSPILGSYDLFPFGILSSKFGEWSLTMIMEFIDTLSSQTGIRKPNFKI